MPKRWKKRYTKKQRKGKTLKISTKQARTKAYDSKIEKLIARVAKQEINKGKVILVHRRTRFGTYSPITNEFIPTTLLDYTGITSYMTQIPKTNIDFVTTAHQTDRIETQIDEEAIAFPMKGSGTGQLTQLKQGYRSGDQIRVTGILVKFRVTTMPTPDAPAMFNKATIYWGVSQFKIELSNVGTQQIPLLHTRKLLPINPWNYERRIDVTGNQSVESGNTRVHARGQFNIPISTHNIYNKFYKRYIKLKRPVTISWTAADQAGLPDNVLDNLFYVTLRSDIPDDSAYDDYKPYVVATTSVYYEDL